MFGSYKGAINCCSLHFVLEMFSGMNSIGGSKLGCQGCAPPLSVHFLLFSCSFLGGNWSNKTFSRAPLELAPPALLEIPDLPLNSRALVPKILLNFSEYCSKYTELLKHQEFISLPGYPSRNVILCNNSNVTKQNTAKPQTLMSISVA